MSSPRRWKDVRDETCRLFNVEKRPLQEVMSILSAAPWNFNASSRAFRYHLKKWGARRIDGIGQISSNYSHVKRRRTTLSVSEQRSSAAAKSVTWESGDTTSCLTQYHDRDMGIWADPVVERHCVCQSLASTPSSFMIYEDVRKALEQKDVSRAKDTLRLASLAESSDTVLHIAAKKKNALCLGFIAKHVTDCAQNIDMLDSQGSTALEIAIRADLLENVDKLLHWKAQPNLKNGRGQQALHVAVLAGASARIHKRLLDAKADVNASLSNERPWTAPVNMVFEKLKQTKDEREALCWYEILGQLFIQKELDPWATTNWAPIAFCKFIELWVKSVDRQRLFEKARICLTYLLARGADPTEPCLTLGGCCNSLAAIAFFHSPHDELANLVIVTSKIEKFGPRLVYCLLEPCNKSLFASARRTTESLLGSLMHKVVTFNAHDNPVSRVLQHTRDHDKVGLLRTMVKKQPTLVSKLLEDPQRAIISVSNISEAYKYDIAEILLPPRPQNQPQTPFDKLIVWAWSQLWLWECEDACRRLEVSLLVHLQQGPLRCFNPVADEEASGGSDPALCLYSFTQCIIHLITKRLIDNQLMGATLPPVKRLIIALRLRRQYQLPEIPVKNELILGVLNDMKVKAPDDHQAIANEISMEDVHPPMTWPST